MSSPRENDDNAPGSPENDDATETITLHLTHHGNAHSFTLPSTWTLADLNEAITSSLGIAASDQKLMISPKIGLLRPPYKDPNLSLSTLAGKKIQLLAPLASEVADLAAASSRAARPRQSVLKSAKPARTIDRARIQADATYTFHRIVPLGYLPGPERSARFLERLANDPGIRAAMRKHKFAVGTLTEMDPAMHTTRESKTLGLNRNRGEVIELRLRTDAYDGYRDYKTIRKTLCHELAHNVWGDHDRSFYDLMAQIEKEVKAADWTRGGRSVGEEEFYNPEDGGVGEDHVDGGGWTGGEYVLGRADKAQQPGAAPDESVPAGGLSRRELMAKAAEARMKKEKEAEGGNP